MKESRHIRRQRQQSLRWMPIILISIIVLFGVVCLVLWRNISEKTKSESIQTTQSVSLISDLTTVSTTTTMQTTKVKTKLVVENGIARVGDIIIVNKKYGLPKDYNPGEDPIAGKAFLELKKAMQQKGFAVSDYYSGFRSYTYQTELYNSYVQKDGQAVADRTSARPGHSEHQTGLAFDFVDTTGQLLGEGIQDGAVEWLAEHAHEYGFIVRYLDGKEHITGYMAETWHIRYVGDLAEEIYRSGLTLEEFFGIEGGDYADE